MSAAYIFKDFGTKIHGQVGTGYRTPSLYEIYGGYLYNGKTISIGNPGLVPEESTGYEIGIDQKFCGERLSVGFTWFHTDFDNLIIYDGFDNKYMNADKGTTEGFEAYVNLAPTEWFHLALAYTYADPRYKEDGEWEREEYLPRNKFSGLATFIPYQGVTASLRLVWQDAKIVPLYDPGYNQVRWKEAAVVTMDAAISYRFLDRYQTWVRVENLFDEHYSEGGFTMPGRWFYGGIKFTF